MKLRKLIKKSSLPLVKVKIFQIVQIIVHQEEQTHLLLFWYQSCKSDKKIREIRLREQSQVHSIVLNCLSSTADFAIFQNALVLVSVIRSLPFFHWIFTSYDIIKLCDCFLVLMVCMFFIVVSEISQLFQVAQTFFGQVYVPRPTQIHWYETNRSKYLEIKHVFN